MNALRDGSDPAGHDVTLKAAEMTAAGYVAAMEAIASSSEDSHGMHPVINGHLILRHDSVAAVVDSLVRVQLRALHQAGPSMPPMLGLRSLLNQAALHLMVGQETEAQQCFAAWLARPGVSAQDSLVTFGVAVELLVRTFGGDPTSQERLRLARHYMAQLEGKPIAAAARTLFGARMNMMAAYTSVGDADSAVANGFRAYAVMHHAPLLFAERALLATDPGILIFAQVLAGRPHGLAQLDSLVAVIKQAMVVPPALLAQDTALGQFAQDRQEAFGELEAKFRWFGHAAPPVVATHWFNRAAPATSSDAAPGARRLPLDDGIIRILIFGGIGCPACLAAMAHMEKDQRLLPRGIEILSYEWTSGSWGNELVEPDTEVEHIRHHWIERKHYTVPIAIWAGPKDTTPQGGLLPRPSPTATALHIDAYPTVVVVDGHGIVRYWLLGYFSSPSALEKILAPLVRERDHDAAAHRAAGTTPSSTATPESAPVPLGAPRASAIVLH